MKCSHLFIAMMNVVMQSFHTSKSLLSSVYPTTKFWEARDAGNALSDQECLATDFAYCVQRVLKLASGDVCSFDIFFSKLMYTFCIEFLSELMKYILSYKKEQIKYVLLQRIVSLPSCLFFFWISTVCTFP